MIPIITDTIIPIGAISNLLSIHAPRNMKIASGSAKTNPNPAPTPKTYPILLMLLGCCEDIKNCN